MKSITEKMGVHKEWYKEAKDDMSMEKLPKFLKKLTEEYTHDYGTIVHALTAGAIATMWAMDRTPQGGITGFQASCIMWQFIQEWMHYRGGMKLIQYDDMLYPQHEDRFAKVISKTTWERLQKEARKNLDEGKGVDRIKAHWQSIINGVVPFGYIVKEEE